MHFVRAIAFIRFENAVFIHGLRACTCTVHTTHFSYICESDCESDYILYSVQAVFSLARFKGYANSFDVLFHFTIRKYAPYRVYLFGAHLVFSFMRFNATTTILQIFKKPKRERSHTSQTTSQGGKCDSFSLRSVFCRSLSLSHTIFPHDLDVSAHFRLFFLN